MSTVFLTTYEVIGALDAARAHYAAINAAVRTQWAFVTEVNGEGFRPDSNGGVRSIFFHELPPGWRKIGSENGNVEAVPHKGSNLGKVAARKLLELPRAPQPHALASAFGYNPPHFAIENGRIYFATDLTVTFPSERIFLRLPRFADDGFVPDEDKLRAIPESEFMAAIEAHNAEARRLREAQEGGAA
ncbi:MULTISPECIES: hypothetical protein [unclassified Novosphingobium]|uniref:hypothetical protein n=1 Tax=unclassified Novosphingobium TaxID=2644732 RepID=UPI000D30EA3B|nr:MULTISPECIES: hypothetical protein [unclassified Novosphingobium]PTR05067.1 hypothetical protein C8K11_1476 [Novosphingobium sp. GV055]PUA93656.1 hypothetical protein C8K12_1485 [Novosphingobium sp. GV061]PUB10433.1 hypothetical protein C8K14_1446 [Novosphingobium sp. GV079]PUB35960.1 hypothetical protein C8K10_1552 [Novosphingobium sp. GV027]